MHELSIIHNIINIIEYISQKAGLVKITRVVLQVGELRQIVPHVMQFAFEAASKDTMAEKAALELETIPLRVRCKACGRESGVENNVFICAHCGDTSLDVIEGEELIIKHIEGEI
jgi:hydrogenase nickel incorporation protein HypA/HybF